MKQTQYDSLGLKVLVNAPETAEEFDNLAGKIGACVEEAVNNVAYRDTLADFRSTFCEALEAETSIPRTREQALVDGKPKTTEDGKPILVFTESEGKYISRIRATKDLLKPDAWQTAYQPLANRVVAGVAIANGTITDSPDNAITLDPKAREKKAKTVPETYLKLADEIIAKNSVDKAVKVLSDYLGVPVGTDRTSLATAIRSRELKRQREANADILAA